MDQHRCIVFFRTTGMHNLSSLNRTEVRRPLDLLQLSETYAKSNFGKS